MDSTNTLLGGIELTINGAPVFVRQLPVKLYPKLQQLLAEGDECKLVALYCDKPEGWADSLKPEGHDLIITTAEELNRDFFSRWENRQRERQKRLQEQMAASSSLLAALPENVVSKITDAITGSMTSLPKSPPPADSLSAKPAIIPSRS